ncbi:hypothetical protein PPTG_24344 [Phytophthora nicotianae INRA-310]|uniref:Uncharacterized protein n=1 Tax=Phytophthora nicotianae (strain INRA-310) TaxID=761204 RepID=W2PG65_PHYN3|nr:hypothetical protein PPTG_24344 [Phytophthora nicotianae INRA-310]ETN00028.1 hypothetical protein PPTG_24344 [Phytophthora nicotianae INRA-310]
MSILSAFALPFAVKIRDRRGQYAAKSGANLITTTTAYTKTFHVREYLLWVTFANLLRDHIRKVAASTDTASVIAIISTIEILMANTPKKRIVISTSVNRICVAIRSSNHRNEQHHHQHNNEKRKDNTVGGGRHFANVVTQELFADVAASFSPKNQ